MVCCLLSNGGVATLFYQRSANLVSFCPPFSFAKIIVPYLLSGSELVRSDIDLDGEKLVNLPFPIHHRKMSPNSHHGNIYVEIVGIVVDSNAPDAPCNFSFLRKASMEARVISRSRYYLPYCFRFYLNFFKFPLAILI